MAFCPKTEPRLLELRPGESNLFDFDFTDLVAEAGATALVGSPAPTVTQANMPGAGGAVVLGSPTVSGVRVQVRIDPGTAVGLSRFLMTCAATDNAASPNRHVVYGFLDVVLAPTEPAEECA